MISDWITRLKAHTRIDVHGVAGLDAAQTSGGRDAVYVVLTGEKAPDNTVTGPVRQMARTIYSLIIKATNSRDTSGAGGASEIEQLRGAIRQAVLGWTPPDASGPVVYKQGRLVGFGDTTLWWQDEYEIPVLISEHIQSKNGQSENTGGKNNPNHEKGD